MEHDEVFSVLSLCFSSVDADLWKQMTTGSSWSDFLDASRRVLQDNKPLGLQSRPLEHLRTWCPLQDFLSVGEVKALYSPPSYEEKSFFDKRHFTGGLPEAAIPVESLYTTWSNTMLHAPLAHHKGMYGADSAQYMRQLIERLGMKVPQKFAACPDHLALELDLLALMVRAGMHEEAKQFLSERFAWLTDYRIRLLKLKDDARFYIGLVDVLLGIRAQLGVLADGDEAAEVTCEVPKRAV